MKENLTTSIREYQKGNHEYSLLIIEKLHPAINKYANKLFCNAIEDSVSELNLAILESLKKIPYVKTESQCLTFLIKVIENKYLELLRKSIKISVSELPLEEQSLICPYLEYEYENRELKLDLENLLSKCSAQQRKILLSVIFDNKSSSQIAAELHTTRQYVNCTKRKLLKQIEKEIFAKSG